MGCVYKATQLLLDRTLALKICDASFSKNKQSSSRFKREAMVLSKVSHPNIVTFYHYGLWQDNVPYIAMEYVEGKPLHKYMADNGEISADKIRDIMLQLADALSVAHENGILHRDLKPSNIMLLDSPKQDTVKLLDFGLARLFEKNQQQGEKLTKTGLLIGTAEYMSPEQCRGEKLDARCDIYSFGCVLYELLSGKPPFQGDNSFALIHQHNNSEIKAIPTEVTGKGVEYKNLASISYKCLAKKKSARYQSMKSLIEDLRDKDKIVTLDASARAISYRVFSPLLIALALLFFVMLFVMKDHWVPFFEAKYLENSKDTKVWNYGIEQAEILRQKKLFPQSAELLKAVLSAATRNKANFMYQVNIKLKLAKVLLQMNIEPEATAYGVQALSDIESLLPVSSWKTLEDEKIRDRIPEVCAVLSQVSCSDARVIISCARLKEVLASRNEKELLINVAELDEKVEWRRARMELHGEALTKELFLAKCYFDGGFVDKARRLWQEIINKGFQFKYPPASTAALLAYTKSLDENERIAQADELNNIAAKAYLMFKNKEFSENPFPPFWSDFYCDLAEFYILFNKIDKAIFFLQETERVYSTSEFTTFSALSLFRYECYKRSGILWHKVGDKQAAEDCYNKAIDTLTKMGRTEGSLALLIGILELLTDNGSEQDAGKQFEKYFSASFPKLIPPSTEADLWREFKKIGKPSKVLYFEERLIALSAKQKDFTNLIIARQMRTATLLRLEKYEEALKSILETCNLNGASSAYDWNLKAKSVWQGMILFLSNNDLPKAEQLVDGFSAKVMSPGVQVFIDWNHLYLAARKGDSTTFEQLKKNIEASASYKESVNENRSYMRMAESDLLIQKRRYTEAKNILDKLPRTFVAENLVRPYIKNQYSILNK